MYIAENFKYRAWWPDVEFMWHIYMSQEYSFS